VAFWGVICRGGVVVPVDFMSGLERAEAILRLTGAKLVIQSSLKAERITGTPSILFEDMAIFLEGCQPAGLTQHTEPDDTAELLYTSGTTGNPKGVVLTHRNLMANLSQVNRHIPQVNERFNFLSLLPLSHMFEQMGGLLVPLSKGSSIVYLRTLKPSAIMEAFNEEDIYAVIAVPRLLQLLQGSVVRRLQEKGIYKIIKRLQEKGAGLSAKWRRSLFAPINRHFGKNFTLFVSGGAPLAPETFRFWSRLGLPVVEGYGLTECSPVLTANTLEQQEEGSVGIPINGVDIRIDNGEIQARGENVFHGYFNNKAATTEAFTEDGWFRTGDLGEFMPSGSLRIKGRSKELIVTGSGINVYPDEIEAVLLHLPGVRDACVVGLDRGFGEEVHAVLLLDGSGVPPEEIIAGANAGLDELHRITGFSIWGEAEFPKTTTLKVQKFKVKERLKGEGGSGGVTADRLVAIIARVTGVIPEEVREEGYLVNDLGLTSIGRLELVNILEQEFRLDLEDSLIGLQTRVADLRRIITSREQLEQRHIYQLWVNGSSARFIRRLLDTLLHYPIVRAFVKLHVRGEERIGAINGPVLFISNHMSYLDQPVIMSALPPEIRYSTATAAWEEFFFDNYKNMLQKIWKRLCYIYGTPAFNFFPFPQSRGFRPALRHMGRLVDRGSSLLVFPEGERSMDGLMLPFKNGLGVMVKELGIPVVPLNITGLEKVFPRGAHWPRRGEVTITIGHPLDLQQEPIASIVEIAQKAVAALAGE
jgi:long-chain acyl-CoA synthetase